MKTTSQRTRELLCSIKYTDSDNEAMERIIESFEQFETEIRAEKQEIHTKEFYLTFSAPRPASNLYRRLEKRPYSGKCNLRF